MLVIARLRPVTDDTEEFLRLAADAVAAWGERPGHVMSRLARALDDPSLWVLVSEWENVGSYRRALSSYDVRMASGALMGAVINEPTAYDEVELATRP